MIQLYQNTPNIPQNKVMLLRNQFENLRNYRSGLERSWDLVLRLVQPNYRLNEYFSKLNSQPKLQEGYDYSVLKSLYHNRGAVNSGILSSYLHANLTNPHADWMKLTLPEIYHLQGNMTDQQLTDLTSLQLISQECHNAWQSSNFHSAMYPFYKNLVDIGTSCLLRYFVNKGRKKELYFGNLSMFNVYFMEDAFGYPSHIFGIYNWTVYQIRSMFFKHIKESQLHMEMPQSMYQKYMTRSIDTFSVVHSILPSGDKFESVYFYYNNQKTYQRDMKELVPLEEKLIDYNPYSISRIRKNPESAYGTGFSMEAYPLLAALQEMQKDCWIASEKNVNPPVNTPTDRLKGKYSTSPGVHNPMDTIGGKPVGIAPSMPPINIADLLQNKTDLLMDIDKTYMVDKIIMESVKHNRSATEVQKRTGEEIKILSPFIGSLESEFLRPLVEVTLSYFKQSRKGTLLEKALSQVSDKTYRLQYTSPIAQMQIQKQIQNMLEFFGVSNAISQKENRIDIKQNWLAFWEKLAILMNAPMDTMNNQANFQKGIQLLEQQAQEASQREGLTSMGTMGDTYKNLMQGEKFRREVA